jgi:hypothetical protein
MSSPLQKELETFAKALPNLLDKLGKYALVRGESVASVWDTYEDAIQEGYKQFGLSPFLVKQIQVTEPVYHFTRDVRPICRPSTPN